MSALNNYLNKIKIQVKLKEVIKISTVITANQDTFNVEQMGKITKMLIIRKFIQVS